MTLVATLIPLARYSTGEFEYTVATITTLTSLQEPESGWLLCNGASIPNSGKYVALYAFLGTLYGVAGTLPTLIDGVQPVAKGATNYPTINATDGGITTGLTIEQITNLVHTWDYESASQPLQDGWVNVGSTPPFDDGAYLAGSTSAAAGGGGNHNNMPPYLVVEGMLIKL